jgi:hypothetical protein
LQQLPAAIPGEVVSDVVLPVSEAVTNAIRCGFLRIPHRSPDEPCGRGRWLIGQLVDELCFVKARSETL